MDFGWTQPFSSKRILVTYDGTIKAGVDLKEADIQVNDESRSILISLPPSVILENNIPQETITVVEVKDGLFNEVTLDDYNNFISQQKIVMEDKAISRGLLTEADEEAHKIVTSFVSRLPGIEEYTLTVE